jgi:hypothetical protein
MNLRPRECDVLTQMKMATSLVVCHIWSHCVAYGCTVEVVSLCIHSSSHPQRGGPVESMHTGERNVGDTLEFWPGQSPKSCSHGLFFCPLQGQKVMFPEALEMPNEIVLCCTNCYSVCSPIRHDSFLDAQCFIFKIRGLSNSIPKAVDFLKFHDCFFWQGTRRNFLRPLRSAFLLCGFLTMFQVTNWTTFGLLYK